MAENLAKFNSAMSQFQSGSEGINNYLSSASNRLASSAQSAVADAIGISQEDKQALDDNISMITGAAPLGLAAVSRLKGRAFPKKVTGKGSESGKATEAAKGKASETGKAAEGGKTGETAEGGEAPLGGGTPEVGSELTNMEGEGQSLKAAEFPESELFGKGLGSTPNEGPGTSDSAGSGAKGVGEDAEEGAGEDAEDVPDLFGEGAAEGAAEGGEVAAGAGETAAVAGEGAAVAAGAGETAAVGGSLLSFDTAVAAVPVLGELAVAATAGYAIYEGISDILGGTSNHNSEVTKAFSGDIATTGESSAFTSGSYAVASNDGITTQTGGSSAF